MSEPQRRWTYKPTNAGYALTDPDGKDQCWEWDGGEDLAKLVVDALNSYSEKPLAWTSTLPTVAGWYWWRRMPECKPATYHVLFEAGKWWILEGGFGTDGDYIPLDDIQGGEWAGPLEPPV